MCLYANIEDREIRFASTSRSKYIYMYNIFRIHYENIEDRDLHHFKNWRYIGWIHTYMSDSKLCVVLLAFLWGLECTPKSSSLSPESGEGLVYMVSRNAWYVIRYAYYYVITGLPC